MVYVIPLNKKHYLSKSWQEPPKYSNSNKWKVPNCCKNCGIQILSQKNCWLLSRKRIQSSLAEKFSNVNCSLLNYYLHFCFSIWNTSTHKKGLCFLFLYICFHFFHKKGSFIGFIVWWSNQNFPILFISNITAASYTEFH